MSEQAEKKPRFWEEGHLSFSGAGFIGIYHVGVAQAFKRFAPHIASRKVLGASSGALAGMCLTANYPIDRAIHGITKMSTHCRSLTLGPFDPRYNIFDIMRNDLIEFIHEEAHFACSNKLFISLTRVPSLQNEVMSEFESREELIDALTASCFIPYFLGIIPPKVRGVSYVDGGITDNLPTHDEHTITISPFAGIASIRPRPSNTHLPDIIYTPENAVRMVKTVCSPAPDALANICQEGFEDALRFIREHDLFACESCATLSTRSLRDECLECQQLAAQAEVARVSSEDLWPLEEALVAELQRIRESPFQHSALMRMGRFLGALAFYPVFSSVALARKTFHFWDDIVDVAKRSTWNGYSALSNYAHKLLRSSDREVCGGPGTALEGKVEGVNLWEDSSNSYFDRRRNVKFGKDSHLQCCVDTSALYAMS